MAKNENQKPIFLTTKQIAEFFNVTMRTVQAWDCPKESKNKLNLKLVFDWYLENGKATVSDKDKSYKEALSKYRAKLARLEYQEKKRLVLPKSEFYAEWTQRVSDLRQSLDSMSDTLAPLLINLKNEHEVIEILNSFVEKLLLSYCAAGKFTVINNKKTSKKTTTKTRKKTSGRKAPKKLGAKK